MTQQHAGDISELKAGQARLEVGVQGLGSKLDQVVSGVSQVTRDLHRPPEKPNLMGLVTTACVVGGLLGALAMSVISPIKRDVDLVADRQHTYMVEAADEAYSRGKHDQMLIDLDNRVSHLDELDHLRDEQLLELFKEVSESRVSRRATGEYLKEHVSKEGTQGHPKAERTITTKTPLGVEQR